MPVQYKENMVNTRRTTQKRGRKTNSKHTGTGFSLRNEIVGIIFILLAIFLLAGIWGFEVGNVGAFMAAIFTYGFGIGAFVPCLALLYLGWMYLYYDEGVSVTKRGFVMTIFFLSLLTLVPLWRVPDGHELMTMYLNNQGGVVGGMFAGLLRALLGNTWSIVAVAGLAIICFITITRWSLRSGLYKAKEKAVPVVDKAKDKAGETFTRAKEQFSDWKEQQQERKGIYNQEKDPRYPINISRNNMGEQEEISFFPEEEEDDVYLGREDAVESWQALAAAEKYQNERLAPEKREESSELESTVGMGAENNSTVIADIPTFEGTSTDTAAVSVSLGDGTVKPRRIERPYRYPPLTILSKSPKSSGLGGEVAEKAQLLEETLKSFGVSARIINATQGPAVTRYELEPAAGVKVNKIVNLTDDIALKLAATDIRMEAPIPGKAAIGIEVPNKSIAAVHLRDVLDSDDFLKAKGGIPVGLGKDIAGKPIITDLAKMPHLLVAGSTGSGKSVCINTLISSILFSRKPEDVKLILIDPKMVELSNYNGIPHLMAPVVTDTKKAAAVLRWAVKEMEARYRTFAASNVRDITRYNELYPNASMPLVVIIIDELADLMMVSPVDVEDSICRLAQMARAAGLHLVLATQRPSVDVITGTIKANVPSRISFAVSSQIDSRTILDMAGAEKLLGKGDMLFNPIGASKPIRIQGAFISDSEVEKLVDYIKAQGTPNYSLQVEEELKEAPIGEEENVFEDELLERAIELVMESGQASVSMLQRRFRIGYTRAARLVDTMEDMKIVGPNMGSKAREILMTAGEVKEKYFSSPTEK